MCVVFGHEVDGLQPNVLEACDTHVRIPMLGSKHSLNVATAGGVVIYEILRKYRGLVEGGLYAGAGLQPRLRVRETVEEAFTAPDSDRRDPWTRMVVQIGKRAHGSRRMGTRVPRILQITKPR